MHSANYLLLTFVNCIIEIASYRAQIQANKKPGWKMNTNIDLFLHIAWFYGFSLTIEAWPLNYISKSFMHPIVHNKTIQTMKEYVPLKSTSIIVNLQQTAVKSTNQRIILVFKKINFLKQIIIDIKCCFYILLLLIKNLHTATARSRNRLYQLSQHSIRSYSMVRYYRFVHGCTYNTNGFIERIQSIVNTEKITISLWTLIFEIDAYSRALFTPRSSFPAVRMDQRVHAQPQ